MPHPASAHSANPLPSLSGAPRARREGALRRIRAQLPLEEKRELADFVIDNAGSLQELEEHLRAFYETVTASSATATSGAGTA